MTLNREEGFLAGPKFDQFGDFWGLNREIDKSGKTEMDSDDIVDLLPQDPFDMDISNKVTALTGWLEHINKDFGLNHLGFVTDEIEVDAQLFAGLNIVLNGAMRIHQDVGVQKIGENSYVSEIDIGEGLHSSFGCMDVEMEDIISSGYWVLRDAAHEDESGINQNDHCDGDEMEDIMSSGYWVYRDAAHEDQSGINQNDQCDGDEMEDIMSSGYWFYTDAAHEDQSGINQNDHCDGDEMEDIMSSGYWVYRDAAHEDQSGINQDDHCDGDEMEDIMSSGYFVIRDAAHEDQSGMNQNDHCDGDGGAPSDALYLALNYLGLRDLLSIERVCKSFRDVVRSDPLLWRNIHVDHPLSNKITDDILLKLTDRAEGHLDSLSLVHCSRITDSSLNCVLERNPNLKKLSVPGCGRLTADSILWNLKVLKSAGKPRLKYLGIDGLFGMTHQHFEEFKVLLGVDSSKLPSTRKPRFFQGNQLSVSSDDDHAIDIEICPKCQQLRVVYDCPSQSCQKKKSTAQLCRACTICIKRCINCGRCLNNCEYEELFSFDLLCLDCCREVLDRKERQEKQTSCHFFICG